MENVLVHEDHGKWLRWNATQSLELLQPITSLFWICSNLRGKKSFVDKWEWEKYKTCKFVICISYLMLMVNQHTLINGNVVLHNRSITGLHISGVVNLLTWPYKSSFATPLRQYYTTQHKTTCILHRNIPETITGIATICTWQRICFLWLVDISL